MAGGGKYIPSISSIGRIIRYPPFTHIYVIYTILGN